MPKTRLIVPLCEVIEDSNTNTNSIFDKLNEISILIDDLKLEVKQKQNINSKLMEVMDSLQYQDLHKQKIERVINNICEVHNIDSNEFNIAKSAKTIESKDSNDIVSDDELEELIKQMS